MTFSLRLNDDEANIIRSYAKLKNQTVSEVMRSAIMEQIETEYDLQQYEMAMNAFKANPVTHSQSDIERELGLR